MRRGLPSPRREAIEDAVHTRNDELVKMTKHIMEIGPHIGEVARRTGVFKETSRYRFNRYFLQRGFVVQANLDYQRLGLKRLIIIAKVAPIFEEHAVAVMTALSEMCYLTGFAETTLEGLYIMQVTVPWELREECSGLYKRLHGNRNIRENADPEVRRGQERPHETEFLRLFGRLLGV